MWLEGLDVDRLAERDPGSRSNGSEDYVKEGVGSSACLWAIGAVRVTSATLWAALEETLTSLVLHHWEALARYCTVLKKFLI